MRKRSLCCRSVTVRPSVYPSVTLVYCIQTVEEIVKLLYRPGSPMILVFDLERRYSIALQRGRKIHGGRKFLRFTTEIAVYLGNGTR